MISLNSFSLIYMEESGALGKEVISKDTQNKAAPARTLYLAHTDMLLPKLHMDPGSRLLYLPVGFLNELFTKKKGFSLSSTS